MTIPVGNSLRASWANHTVLVIDDNEAVGTAFDVLLSMHGVRVLTSTSPADGLAQLRRETVDLVLQDMNFRREATRGEEGMELFREIRSHYPDLPIILLTAWTHLEMAVELVKAGASDYIAKPWDDARLLTTVRNLLDLRRAQSETRAIQQQRREARAELAERRHLCGIVYQSDAMHTLISTATHVAHADVPILITGPNGAGKEVIATIVQANSSVRDKPFIKVNLGALPNDLMEAELFGTEAGAFTGAKARIGRFEAADGGTLFMDELGNLSGSGQAKLLQVLQTGEFERLGSSTTRKTQVRVIAATNANLRQMIREGKFREDLFYRLNVIELEVPALADRRDDILPLAQAFLEKGFSFGPDAERALQRHDWPGNVRELQNATKRACLLSTTPVISAVTLNLPATPAPPPDEARAGSQLHRRSAPSCARRRGTRGA